MYLHTVDLQEHSPRRPGERSALQYLSPHGQGAVDHVMAVDPNRSTGTIRGRDTFQTGCRRIGREQFTEGLPLPRGLRRCHHRQRIAGRYDDQLHTSFVSHRGDKSKQLLRVPGRGCHVPDRVGSRRARSSNCRRRCSACAWRISATPATATTTATPASGSTIFARMPRHRRVGIVVSSAFIRRPSAGRRKRRSRRAARRSRKHSMIDSVVADGPRGITLYRGSHNRLVTFNRHVRST